MQAAPASRSQDGWLLSNTGSVDTGISFSTGAIGTIGMLMSYVFITMYNNGLKLQSKDDDSRTCNITGLFSRQYFLKDRKNDKVEYIT